jgi:hypothetical protein
MCHFSGIYIGYTLKICLVEDESSLSSSMNIFPYLNLRVCVICALVIQGTSYNGFDHYMCMFMLESHLSTQNMVFVWFAVVFFQSNMIIYF